MFLIGRITEIFHYFSRTERVILKILYFIKEETKHSFVVRLQRYWWIFRNNFIVDSHHPPKSVQNTCVGNNIDLREDRFVN